MTPTRILLVGLPRLLEEIVSDALAQAPDMSLAGTLEDAQELIAQAATTPADVVVLGTDDPQLIASALMQQPHLKVLAVTEDARSSSLYVLRPERTRIGDLSAASLVTAIRDAARPVATWWAR
jgi:chemotaxis response regulator CheB